MAAAALYEQVANRMHHCLGGLCCSNLMYLLLQLCRYDLLIPGVDRRVDQFFGFCAGQRSSEARMFAASETVHWQHLKHIMGDP
jgi:hypothetical protein